jgi:hypothetical protein
MSVVMWCTFLNTAFMLCLLSPWRHDHARTWFGDARCAYTRYGQVGLEGRYVNDKCMIHTVAAETQVMDCTINPQYWKRFKSWDMQQPFLTNGGNLLVFCDSKSPYGRHLGPNTQAASSESFWSLHCILGFSSSLVTWWTDRFNIQQLYILPTWYFKCFVFISEQKATLAVSYINWCVFITDMKSVYCAVRTESLNG